MKKKDHYNVLAVYSLRDLAGREHFAGILSLKGSGTPSKTRLN